MMASRARRRRGAAALALVTLGVPLRAQQNSIPVATLPVTSLSSEPEERIRLSQVIAGACTNGFLMRSVSRLTMVCDSTWVQDFGMVGPELRTVRNSELPFSINNGPLWAGRGWNGALSIGIFGANRTLRVIFAPTVVFEENRPFQVIPYPQSAVPARSVWANPFHPLPESIDLPLRFGDRARQRLDPGQSSVTVNVPVVSFGLATENLWWGPGVQNAITLSDNAPGFPHAFIQMRPTRTSAGTFDAQWILGQLHESAYFDADPSDNARSLNGLAVTWTPPFDDGLTLGSARLVMAKQSNGRFATSSLFDVFRHVGQPDTDTSSTAAAPGRDQILTFFGRWVLVPAGFEAYLEWARFEEPTSLRDLFEYPGHSEAYTLGFQWARPIALRTAFRLQGEASYFEPDPSLRLRPVAVTYTSRAVPQGFTNRGQTLGAAIGPGASSQWLAADVFSPDWRLGAYLNRIRWDNGTLFEPIVPQFRRQDITLLAGLRGSVSMHGVNFAVDFAHAARFDYLFQAYVISPVRTGGIDILNNTLSVTVSTALGPR
jgi:hypothetical protein